MQCASSTQNLALYKQATADVTLGRKKRERKEEKEREKKNNKKKARLLSRRKFHSWFPQTLFLPAGCFASAFCFFLHSSVTVLAPTEKHSSQNRAISYCGSSRRDIFFWHTQRQTQLPNTGQVMYKWGKKHLVVQIWNSGNPGLAGSGVSQNHMMLSIRNKECKTLRE